MLMKLLWSETIVELRSATAGQIATMTEHTRGGVIFFNNHVRAQAPRNAVKLMNLLIESGLLEKET